MDESTPATGDGARELKIVHRSRYEYAEPVTLQEHRLMFRPRDSHDLRLLQTSLSITPQARIRWIHDPFGNSVAIARFAEPARALEIESTIVARQYGLDARDAPVDMHAQHLPVSYPHDEAPDVARYAERHYPDPDRMVDSWSRRFLEEKGPTDTLRLLVRMTEEIKSTFSYGVRMEDGTQAPTTTLRQRSGTCRDFALLMMEAARSLGLAARFVTGYLYQADRDEALGMPRQPSWPHAWLQVYLPGAGWLEFDPTNALFGNRDLIRVGVARDPDQAMPVKGSFTGTAGACTGVFVDVSISTVTGGAVAPSARS